MSIIAIHTLERYDQALADQAVARQLDALHIDQEIKPGMKVLLKPNLLSGRKPELCVTTHPVIIRAVANYLRAHAITDITLADSPGGPYSAQMLSGVYRACDLVQLGDVLTLNQDFTSRQVPAAPGCSQQDFAIITPVLDADYIINLPKMKTHGMTTLSLGVKNLFGCIPGLLKPRLHYSNPSYDGFAQMLTSLTETVKPNLTLIDAVEGMEGNGPGSGTVRHRGLILASRDIFAQDYVAAQLMGVDPRSVLMIQVQLARGLIVPEQIERIGDDALPSDPPFVLPDHISRVDFTSHLPKPLQKPAAQLMDSLIKQVPLVDQIKCIGCGKCAESCPQHIIEMNDRKADIHLSKCISCFCCQEMCPVKAISVRRKFRFLK